MKKAEEPDEDMRPEYERADLGVGVRGKYYEQYRKAHNLVLLEPEVAAIFPTDEAVNSALLSLVRIARAAGRSASQPAGTTRKRRSGAGVPKAQIAP